jgi:hypothetical protein
VTTPQPPPPGADPSWEHSRWGEPVTPLSLQWAGAEPDAEAAPQLRRAPAAAAGAAPRAPSGARPVTPARTAAVTTRPDRHEPPADERVGAAPRRRRTRTVERFKGKRIRHRVGPGRRLRSLVYLVILGAILAAVLAGILGAIVAGLSLAFHHASGN